VAQQTEALVVQQMRDIGLRARREIIGAQDFMAHRQQPIAKMGTQESRAAGDQNP
jgi:hypothetical protein